MHTHHHFFYPLVFPFAQKGWLSRFWWLIILAMIPVMDFIFLRGWRLALVRNMARSEESILPAPEITRLFIDGLILWCMTGIYLVVPTIIIFASGSGSLGDALEAIQFIWGYLTGTDSQTTDAFLSSQVKGFVIRFAAEIIWITISAPIYRIGMIRYASTMRVSCFFNIPLNSVLALRHAMTFIKMWFFNLMMLLFITVVIAISTATVVLAPISALLGLIIYYYATGYEYGHLAQKMNHTHELEADISKYELSEA